MKPEITALMLYYGRRNVAEEAVESFLRQTYPHKKLLIVNTHPDPVHFDVEHKNIEVHNIIPDTFDNLNEKYNYAFTQIKTNWWCSWDSDDIWLPWHMENLVANIPTRRHTDPWKVGIAKCYFRVGGEYKLGWNMWGNCIFESMDSKGNLHPQCDSTISKNCDSQILFLDWDRHWLDMKKYPKSFIFRWDDSLHGSSVTGQDGPAHHVKCREKMYAIRNTEPFRPHWDNDYIAEAQAFDSKPTPKENQ